MSTKVVQLDIFKQEKDIAEEEFKKMTLKSIRALFARYNDMEFLMFEMHKRMEKMSESIYVETEKKDLEHIL